MRLLLVVLLASCAPRVRVTVTKPEWKATPAAYVRVFTSIKAVPRPFDEIAQLAVDNDTGSYPEMVAALREQAAALGAEAIVLDNFTDEQGTYARLSARALTLYAAAKAPGPKSLPKEACAANSELCRFERACKGGKMDACLGIAVALMTGTEIERDPKRAADYFDEACVAGFAAACTHYGLAHFQGAGRAQNDTEAITYFKKACDWGEIGGCRYLGLLYLSSTNVETIAVYAAQFLQKACDGEDGWSCWRLGKMFAEGEHIPQVVERANALYARACTLGVDYACQTP